MHSVVWRSHTLSFPRGEGLQGRIQEIHRLEGLEQKTSEVATPVGEICLLGKCVFGALTYYLVIHSTKHLKTAVTAHVLLSIILDTADRAISLVRIYAILVDTAASGTEQAH